MIIFTYITTNNVNGQQYIGMHVTNNIDDDYLGSGTLLHKAIKKYGTNNFSRDIMNIFTTTAEAHLDEERLIVLHNSLFPNGYNLSPTGGLYFHGKHSEHSKEKMSKNRLGKGTRKRSNKTKKNIRNGLLHYYSKRNEEETKIDRERSSKNGKSNKGKKRSIEVKTKMSIAQKNRFLREKAERLRISRIRKGCNKGQKRTEQQKINMSIAQKGCFCSQETRNKMSISQKNRFQNSEEIMKLSIAQKDRYQRERIKKLNENLIMEVQH